VRELSLGVLGGCVKKDGRRRRGGEKGGTDFHCPIALGIPVQATS
jgi:hypothetical protein